MDLYCKRCGEPWDAYYVNHEMTAEERNNFFAGNYCPACKKRPFCNNNKPCSECEHVAINSLGDYVCLKNCIKGRPFRAILASALGDILGDDVDGIAAEMEDAEQMFGEDFWK